MDHWRHRSQGMRCKTCMWFAQKPDKSGHDDDIMDKPQHERGAIGRCRRHAPTMAGYPVVFENDWCGDHKLDESKT